MKKMVFKLDMHDGKASQKAMSRVTELPGVDSISIDTNDKKLTVTGAVDPVDVVKKLKNRYHPVILSVGPPDSKKEEPKKEEPKKDPNDVSALVEAYKNFNPYMPTYYRVGSMEEDPNACVIC